MVTAGLGINVSGVWSKPLQRMGLNLLVWGLGAALLALLTHWSGLPDSPAEGLFAVNGAASPQGWRFLLYALMPLGFILVALGGEFLAGWISSHFSGPPTPLMMRAISTWRKANQWAFIALPVLMATVVWHGFLGDWALVAGLVWFASLGVQAVFAGRLLWVAAGEVPWRVMAPKKADRLLAGGTALVFLCLFVCLNFWTAHTVSTCGDEQIYLVNTSRLLRAVGLAPHKLTDPQRLQKFYWGRWSKEFRAEIKGDFAFNVILAPGYKAAGRIGALATLSVTAALCLACFFWLLRRLAYPPRTALAATWLMGLTAPFLQMGQHVYPGALAALGVVLGMHLLLKFKEHYWPALAGLALVAGGITVIKDRFLASAAGLALAVAWLTKRQEGGLRRLVVLSLSVLVLGAAGLLALYSMEAFRPAVRHLLASAISPPGFKDLGLATLLALPALFFDQQFGLLIYCPWLALALAGVAFFWRDHHEAAVCSVLIAASTLTIVLIWRWIQWDGGFTPPGRFLAPLLPLFFLWTMPALRNRASRWWQGVLVFLAGASVLISLALSFMPIWRFHRRSGVNNLLAELGDLFDSVIYRFFPSFISYHAPDMLIALPWAALVAVLGLMLWQERKRGEDLNIALGSSWRLSILEATAGATVLLALLVVAGRMVPTWELAGNAMQRQGGLLYGTYYPKRVYLVLDRPGDRAWTRIVWGAHTRRITLVARHQLVREKPVNEKEAAALNNSEMPVIRIAVDGKTLGEVRIRRGWGKYTFSPRLRPGVHTLDINYLFRKERDQVVIDRIILQ